MCTEASELTGAALDWAVAECEGATNLRKNPHRFDESLIMENSNGDTVFLTELNYSSNWGLGGPIIEREDISFRKYPRQGSAAHGGHYAKVCRASGAIVQRKGGGAEVKTGKTPLIAAMRCYVASKMGETVDLPKELRSTKP